MGKPAPAGMLFRENGKESRRATMSQWYVNGAPSFALAWFREAPAAL